MKSMLFLNYLFTIRIVITSYSIHYTKLYDVAKPKPHNITALASSPKPVQEQPEPTPVPESASVKLSPTEETASATSAASVEPQSHGEIISDRISIPAEAKAQVAEPEPAMAVVEVPSRPDTLAPSGAAPSDAGLVRQDNGSASYNFV